MSLSSTAELVDDLEGLGYLERRPDPRDGRAKLVCLTASGWQAIRQGRRIIEAIEADWGQRLGQQRFHELCRALQALIDDLDPGVTPNYVGPDPTDQRPARGMPRRADMRRKTSDDPRLHR